MKLFLIKVLYILKVIIGTLLLVLQSQFVFANSLDSASQISVKILPIAYYTPETKIAAGGLIYSIFKLGNNDSITKKSGTQHYLTYTQNHQYGIENDWSVYTNQNRWLLRGELAYTMFPEFYWGIGSYTKVENKELISFDLLKIKPEFLKHLRRNIYAGIRFHTEYMWNLENANQHAMLHDSTSEKESYFVNGLGLVFIYDSRDHTYTSHKGTYINFSTTSYNQFSLSQYDFLATSLNLRKFIPFSQNSTLALYTLINYGNGDIPFRVMPYIGGPTILRGYYTGRFRDNNSYALQAEFRGNVYRRWGAVVFSGIGDVAGKPQDFVAQQMKYNYGAGIRFKINTKDNVNLRLDYGFSAEGSGLYILFSEAF